jgi:Carboxypeptidase regulatory-like domain
MFRATLAALVVASAVIASSPVANSQESLPVSSIEVVSDAIAPSLDQLYVTQWVTPTANGSLIGRVITPGENNGLPGVRVSLRRQGQTVQSTVSNGDGNFQFVNVEPNYYSLIAEGDGVFSAYAITVLGNTKGKHLPSNFEVPVIRPTGSVILELIRTQSAPTSPWSSFPTFSSADPVGTDRMTHHMVPIPLTQDGSFVGNFAYPGIPKGRYDMSKYIAYLIKDGQRLMQTPLGRDGDFRFANLQPGNYGVVVIGNRGFAAVGIQLANSPLAFAPSNGQRFVSQGSGPTFNLETISFNDVSTTLTDPDDQPLAQDTPLPMGSFGSPSFGSPLGGGGAGGGGLGGGGLFAAAGLAGIAAAIALDDDNNNNFVSPIGP